MDLRRGLGFWTFDWCALGVLVGMVVGVLIGEIWGFERNLEEEE